MNKKKDDVTNSTDVSDAADSADVTQGIIDDNATDDASARDDEQVSGSNKRFQPFVALIFLIIVVGVAVLYSRHSGLWADRQFATLTWSKNDVDAVGSVDEEKPETPHVGDHDQPDEKISRAMDAAATDVLALESTDAQAAIDDDVIAQDKPDDDTALLDELLSNAELDDVTPEPPKKSLQINESEIKQDNSLAMLRDMQETVDTLSQRNTELERSINALEAQLRDQRTQSDDYATLIEHFVTFKRDVIASDNYETSLRMLLNHHALSAEATDQLKYFSQRTSQSIANIEQLKVIFSDGLHRYYTEGMVTDKEYADDSITGNIMRWLRSLVVIRKVGSSHEGGADGAILARAEVAMMSGDIDAALDEVKSLSVHALPFMKEWRRKAHYFVSSRALLDDIETFIITKKSA